MMKVPGLMLATFDLVGQLRDASEAWLGSLGYDWDEISCHDLLDLIHPDDLMATVAAMHHVRVDGTVEGYINRYLHRNGTYRRYIWSACVDDGKGEIVAHARDITPISHTAAEGDTGTLLPLVADATPAMIFLYDLREKRVLYLNRQVRLSLGYPHEEDVEIDNSLGQALLHPDDQQKLQSATEFTSRAQDDQPVESEYRLRHSDGSYRWFWSQSVVYSRAVDGSPIQIVGSLSDVTERKLKEESYQLLFMANPNPMWVFDASTLRFLAVNDAAVDLYGYSRDEFLGMSIMDIRPSEDVPDVLADIRQKGPRDDGRLWRHITRSGEELKVRIYSAVLPYMGRMARLITVQNESEKLAAIDKLSTATETMEAVLHQSPVAIFATDADGFIQTWNPAASAIFGFEEAQALGLRFGQLLSHRSAALANVQRRALSGLAIEGALVRSRRKDGTPVELNVSARPLRTPEGVVSGTVAVVADVTAKNAAERELKRLNKSLEQRVAERTAEFQAANRELEAFCFSVAHDLRAPLRAIDGFSLAVINDYGHVIGSDGISMLERVRAANQRQSEVMDALLALSRVTRASVERQWVDLTDLVTQTASELLLHEPDRKVGIEIESGMRAYGDPRLLRLLFENLLDNALKFTSHTPDAKVCVRTETTAGTVVYFVSDNGAGFDMRYAHKLFQPFERLHTQSEFRGHGVGLATCERVVARHGGHISLVGSVGQGATAVFSLQSGPEEGS